MESRWSPDGVQIDLWSPSGVHLDSVGECKVQEFWRKQIGRGACQIDQMIPAEFQMEFKFHWNGFRNHLEGILPGMRWNGIVAC